MTEIPEQSNFFAMFTTRTSLKDVASLYEAAGWHVRHGKSEIMLTSEHGELVLEADILHGCIVGELANAGAVTEPLRTGAIAFKYELYGPNRELLIERQWAPASTGEPVALSQAQPDALPVDDPVALARDVPVARAKVSADAPNNAPTRAGRIFGGVLGFLSLWQFLNPEDRAGALLGLAGLVVTVTWFVRCPRSVRWLCTVLLFVVIGLMGAHA